MKKIHSKKYAKRAIAVILIATFIAGCSALKKRDGSAAGDAGQASTTASRDIYLDFDDVLIPEDMQRDKKRTFVFRIGALTAGVLVLKGRVAPETLIKFFESNMSRDNWRAASSFRSPRSLLIYEKEERWCIITITEDDFDHKTRVEIWLSPKSEEMGTGLMSE
jgi:hypothetical protein